MVHPGECYYDVCFPLPPSPEEEEGQQGQETPSPPPPVLSPTAGHMVPVLASEAGRRTFTTFTRKLIVALSLLSVPFPHARDATTPPAVRTWLNYESGGSSPSSSELEGGDPSSPCRGRSGFRYPMRPLTKPEIAAVIQGAYIRSYSSPPHSASESVPFHALIEPGDGNEHYDEPQSRTLHLLRHVADADTAPFAAEVGREVEAQRDQWTRYAAFLASVWWRETQWQESGAQGRFEVGPEVRMPDL